MADRGHSVLQALQRLHVVFPRPSWMERRLVARGQGTCEGLGNVAQETLASSAQRDSGWAGAAGRASGEGLPSAAPGRRVEGTGRLPTWPVLRRPQGRQHAGKVPRTRTPPAASACSGRGLLGTEREMTSQFSPLRSTGREAAWSRGGPATCGTWTMLSLGVDACPPGMELHFTLTSGPSRPPLPDGPHPNPQLRTASWFLRSGHSQGSQLCSKAGYGWAGQSQQGHGTRSAGGDTSLTERPVPHRQWSASHRHTWVTLPGSWGRLAPEGLRVPPQGVSVGWSASPESQRVCMAPLPDPLLPALLLCPAPPSRGHWGALFPAPLPVGPRLRQGH